MYVKLSWPVEKLQTQTASANDGLILKALLLETKYNGKTSCFKWEFRGVIVAVFSYFFTLVIELRGVIWPIFGVNRESPPSIFYAEFTSNILGKLKFVYVGHRAFENLGREAAEFGRLKDQILKYLNFSRLNWYIVREILVLSINTCKYQGCEWDFE